MRSIFKSAFPVTIPSLASYLFLGAAYGIYMHSLGFNFLFPMLISITVFAGSMQFVLASLLLSTFNPISALLLTLMVNARHLFYGISMLSRYEHAGKFKPYMIFGLTDETFSILIANDPPLGLDPHRFRFAVTLMDQCYWVLGATVGGLVGSWITFNTQGIEFVMTALFVVIFVEQWLSTKAHTSALVGLLGSALCLVVFGAQNFILPSMALILIALSLLRKPLEKEAAI